MKFYFKHFLLIALLILHVSWGSVVSAQMLGMDLSQNNKILILTSDISAIGISDAETPCPNHQTSLSFSASTDSTIQTSNSVVHDCSDCQCANVLTSIPTLSVTFKNAVVSHRQETIFLASIFPDSPPSFILRPPIS